MSICVPVYNGETFLKEALDSALNQAFHNFELLICDDESTDGSADIIEEYRRKDSRVKVYTNDNRLGLVGNWNRCIELAVGDWIKFLFQDDLLEPHCLASFLSFGERHPEARALFCRREFIYSNISTSSGSELERVYRNGRFLWDRMPVRNRYDPARISDILMRWPEKNVFGEPTNFFIKRDVFACYGKFDPSFRQYCDFEYWSRIGSNESLYYVDDVLAIFRVHESSTTRSNNDNDWLNLRYLERLKLFHKFLESEHYTGLRTRLSAWPCNMYLETQVAIYMRSAKKAVESSSNADWRREFGSFVQLYPLPSERSQRVYCSLAWRYLMSKLGLAIKRWLTQGSASPGNRTS